MIGHIEKKYAEYLVRILCEYLIKHNEKENYYKKLIKLVRHK